MNKKEYITSVGESHPLGATVTDKGVNFAIFSEHAIGVELLIFEKPSDKRPMMVIRLDPKKNKTYSFWHVFVEGLKPGVGYGYKIDGPVEAHNGYRFNKNKLLIDPYGKATSFSLWDRMAACDAEDNVSKSLRSVVIDTTQFDWRGHKHPKTPKQETIIYELHVGGFTSRKNAKVSEPGTFLGLVEKIPYLKSLGITAVELMPVTAFDDKEVIRHSHEGKELTDYWGYSPVNFFSIHPGYCVSTDPHEQINEFRTMVKELHSNGIEVILDMVFNHTDEGNEYGPTTSFRGIDNAIYYHLKQDEKQYYYDFSGCGNSLNCNHPVVAKLIQDSLEYWVKEMKVDGFRLDEASVLSRDQMGRPDGYSKVLWDLDLSEELSETKLIAEAWDAGGLYEIGSFPGNRWSEWNGKYRDAIRRFVRGDNEMSGEMARRISGSQDLYERNKEKPINSVNFITCHDGFTLYDLVSYNWKHNEANGENNQDGINENISWNCGAEGETDELMVNEFRKRQIRNFLTILFISQGIPMMLFGDEVMRTQWGNNNAYCQKNKMSWFDWSLVEKNEELLEFVKRLIDFRKTHKVLMKKNYASGKKNKRGLYELEWHGCRVHYPGWHDPHCKQIAMTLGATEKDEADVFIAVNMSEEDLEFEVSRARGRDWYEMINTAGDVNKKPVDDKHHSIIVERRSVKVLESRAK